MDVTLSEGGRNEQILLFTREVQNQANQTVLFKDTYLGGKLIRR